MMEPVRKIKVNNSTIEMKYIRTINLLNETKSKYFGR